jgi:hypothetical protein
MKSFLKISQKLDQSGHYKLSDKLFKLAIDQAQSNQTYRFIPTSSGEAMFISSGLTKDGFKAQPDIIINFKDISNTFGLHDKKFVPFSKKLPKTEIAAIFRIVQNELAKYPPGWLTERLGPNSQINITSELFSSPADPLKPNAPISTTLGLSHTNSPRIIVSEEGIKDAINHEIGHQIHFNHINSLRKVIPFGQDIPKYDWLDEFLNDKSFTSLATTAYGKTDNSEAFAEAFKWLAENGLDKRFPANDKVNFPKNKLLDIVASVIKQKGYKTVMEDFKNTIQLQYQPGFVPDNTDLYHLRLSTIVGAFQNAIDRFQGNKQAYATDLISNKQKIADIVGFLNKNQSEFYARPIDPREITYALEYLKEKIDKKGYVSQNAQDRKRK